MENKEKEVSYETVILDCAEESFAEKGYANTKMLSIAEAAGVNHALIHYYFRTKENLYEKVVERLFRKWEVKMKTFEWGDDEPEKIIEDYISQYFWFHIESRNYQKIRMWDQIEKRGVFKKYIDKYWAEDLQNKTSVIEKWKQGGLIRKDVNAKFLMHSIWCMVNYFYPYEKEELQDMFENQAALEENYDRVIEQITKLVIYSIK